MEQKNEMQNFEQRLKQLVAMARSNKDVLEVDTINDFFKEMNLEVSQIDKIYEYLDANGILVMSPLNGDEMPDDEELLELDDAEEALVELEDLNALANVMSDDPVKQYLRDIGNYQLLTINEEIELAKRIENGDEKAKAILAEANLRLVDACRPSPASSCWTPWSGAPRPLPTLRTAASCMSPASPMRSTFPSPPPSRPTRRASGSAVPPASTGSRMSRSSRTASMSLWT